MRRQGDEKKQTELKLSKAKELIYLLDGKYYLIGSRACEEYHNEKCISLFTLFYKETDDPLFIDFDPLEMEKKKRNKVAELYKQIESECHVPEDQDRTNNEMLTKLEEVYPKELEEQKTRWLKADTCLTYKQIDELQANSAK